jgi:hypothetical protein
MLLPARAVVSVRLLAYKRPDRRRSSPCTVPGAAEIAVNRPALSVRSSLSKKVCHVSSAMRLPHASLLL